MKETLEPTTGPGWSGEAQLRWTIFAPYLRCHTGFFLYSYYRLSVFSTGLIYATLWQLLLSLMRRRREDQSNGGVSLINKSIVSVSDAQTEICSLPGATAGKIHVETQESLDWATRNLQEVFWFFTWSTFCWLHLCVSTFTFTQASAVKALVMQVGPSKCFIINLVQTEIPEQLLAGLPLNVVHISMVPWGWILVTFPPAPAGNQHVNTSSNAL